MNITTSSSLAIIPSADQAKEKIILSYLIMLLVILSSHRYIFILFIFRMRIYFMPTILVLFLHFSNKFYSSHSKSINLFLFQVSKQTADYDLNFW